MESWNLARVGEDKGLAWEAPGFLRSSKKPMSVADWWVIEANRGDA